MIEIYEKELKELKERMKKAEKFSEKFTNSFFKEQIIEEKLTGEEKHINFGRYYEKMPLRWGICRNKYNSSSNIKITNYNGENYDKYLFEIYVNCYSLFDEYNDFDLENILEKTNIFFYDKWNTTFYIEDEYIEHFLEELNKWYAKALKELKDFKDKKRIEELEEEIKRLKGE